MNVKRKIFRVNHIQLSFLDKNKDPKKYLEAANEKSEKIWNFYFKFVMPGYFVNMICASTASVFLGFYMNGYFDKNIAFLPYYFV